VQIVLGKVQFLDITMTNHIHSAVASQLYDLFDDTKYELSELNQSKQLVLNGPDNKLIKRGLKAASSESFFNIESMASIAFF
jgi:hypothetical protein